MPNQEAEWANELQKTRRSARVVSNTTRQTQINEALPYYLGKLERAVVEDNQPVISDVVDKILSLKAEEVAIALKKDIDLYGSPQPETLELVVEPYGEFAATILHDTRQSDT